MQLRDVKLGPVVVDDHVGFAYHIVSLGDHSFLAVLGQGHERHLVLTDPLGREAQGVAGFDDLVDAYVLVPDAPDVGLYGGSLDVDHQDAGSCLLHVFLLLGEQVEVEVRVVIHQRDGEGCEHHIP